MEALVVKRIVEEPLDQLADYPDFLIGLLIKEGMGKIENHVDPIDKDHICWRFTSRRTGEQKILLPYGIGSYQFRPLLARFGFKVEASPYAGHAHFSVQYEGESEPRPEFFSYYWSNEPETEYWIKLYLHHISGVWPTWGVSAITASD